MTTQMPAGSFIHSCDKYLNTSRIYQLDSFRIPQDYFHNLCSGIIPLFYPSGDCSAQIHQKTSCVGETLKEKPDGNLKWFRQEKLLIVVPKPFPQGRFKAGSEFSCAKREVLFMPLPLRNNRSARQCSVWLLVTTWLSGQNKTRGT